jgi:hypothetical protein
MIRLRIPRRAFCVLAVLPSTALIAAAQTTTSYCTFEVKVKSPTGLPIAGIAVEGTNPAFGFSTKAVTDRAGAVRFCDAPLEASIDFKVGEGQCSVTVHDIGPLWAETRELSVTYQECKQKEMIGFCHIVLRVRDGEGHPVLGVKLSLPTVHGAGQGTTITDEFGRILRTMSWRAVADGTLIKAGYQEEAVTLQCDPNKATSERIVTVRSR